MARLLTAIFLILAVILFPPAVLAYVSQNSVPGDSLYPIKRSLESGILAMASLTPTTRAYFSSSLTQTRFNEATKIIALKPAEAGQSLQQVLVQAQSAASDVQKIQDPKQRLQLATQLSAQLESFNTTLTSLQPTTPIVPIRPQATPTPTPAITPAPTATALASSKPSVIVGPSPSLTPTPTPTLSPSPSTPPPPVLTDIDKTKQELEKIRQELEKDSDHQTPESRDELEHGKKNRDI